MPESTRGTNPIFELVHILFRGFALFVCLLVFEFFFIIAYFDEKVQFGVPLYSYFIGILIFYFMIEGGYSVFHSEESWDNPMNPYLGEYLFLRKIREVIYFILRMLIYFERYVFKYLIFFWFIECIYQYVKAPYNISLISFCIGTVLLAIFSYYGTRMLNKRYFSV